MDLEVIKEAAKSWTVLIVDDNMDNLTVASHILTFCDATVHMTRFGEEAIDIINNNDITVVLLDLAMPHVDGWATFTKIRSNPKSATVPVIAVSAQINDKDKALETGFTGFIPKPFSMQPFLEAIYEYLVAYEKTAESVEKVEEVVTAETVTPTDKEDTPESAS